MEHRLRGSVVSEGMVKGEVLLVTTGEVRVPRTFVQPGQVQRELQNLERALAATRLEIEHLETDVRGRLGNASQIIGTYQSVLQDEEGLIKPIRKLIEEEQHAAAYAVFRHLSDVAAKLRLMPEPLPSRVPDLLDIKHRIIGNLGGRRAPVDLRKLPRRVVIVADDLSPAQTATLDRNKVLAFVTDLGGPAGHTAILARHLGIPAVVGLGDVTGKARSGDTILVDALRGEVVVSPTQDSLREFQSRSRRRAARSRRVSVGPDLKTRDGVPIRILANLDRIEHAETLQKLDIPGVGLFRTEFLFLGIDRAPDEDAQVGLYTELLEKMAPHPVLIRTMDFGADKWDHRLGENTEPNPFLGLRAIRLSFAHEDLFRGQLRAILRASIAGNPHILFPMIMDVEEMVRARSHVDVVTEELRAEGIPFREDIPVGAMIEVPSAGLTAEALMRHADFVSLGTNDLTQYTLAIDRTNPLVAKHFAPHHPGVLKLLKLTIDAAHEANRPVSACGEMAGASEFAPVLLGLGLRTLSMASSRVPDVYRRISQLRIRDCERLAQQMLEADGAVACEDLLRKFR